MDLVLAAMKFKLSFTNFIFYGFGVRGYNATKVYTLEPIFKIGGECVRVWYK